MVPRHGEGTAIWPSAGPLSGTSRMPRRNHGGELGAVNDVLMRLLDAGFGHPRGVLGRLGGALMVLGNGEQERWAVEQAGLRPGHRVLEVGPGPGLGLRLAAAEVSPGGQVIGVDPSAVMREMATARCASLIADGVVTLVDGTAERTGCDSTSVTPRSRSTTSCCGIGRPGSSSWRECCDQAGGWSSPCTGTSSTSSRQRSATRLAARG